MEIIMTTDNTSPNRLHTSLFGEHSSLRAVQMTVQHRHLRAALMQIHNVSTSGTDAFNARLKHILELGLIPDTRPDGKGWRTYGLVDALEISLCLQMQRAFVPPATAVRFIIDHRDAIDPLWKQAAEESHTYLALDVDAFAAIGNSGREKGRGSRGNEVGTIRIRPGRESAPLTGSSLMIDMNDILTQILTRLGSSVKNDLKSRMTKIGMDLKSGMED